MARVAREVFLILKEKQFILVTNNPKVHEKYENHAYIGVEYWKEKGYLDVLISVRDWIHRGWHLLSHPQASNLRPMQCPYKTVLISKSRAAQNGERDVALIENSISAYYKFTKGMISPCWQATTLEDFQTVDLSVIESVINSSLMQQLLFANM